MRIGLIGQGALLGLCCLAASNSYASLPDTRTPINDVPEGTVGLGAALRRGTSPYVGVDNISGLLNDNKTDLIPLYLYEGKWLFAHGTSAGAHLLKQEWLSVDLLAKYRFNRFESDAAPYFNGVRDRDQTVDVGLSATVFTDWGSLSTTWVNDVLGAHNGHEWDFTYSYDWTPGRWSVSPFISYVYQHSDLTDYYYGVDPSEALPERPFYQPDSAVFWRAGINTSYRATPHLLLFSNIASQHVDSEIFNSPLVDESQLTSATFGFAYLFGNALDDSTKRPDSGRFGEWSWRVNAGYQAEGPFTRTLTGTLKRSEDVHAYMTGLTLGKLISDGEYIDYWGRVSLNRRLENGNQSDFGEYNAYVMAMTTGRSPWTSEEWLRFGIGFGFSYASEVPYVEQVKQAKREQNTSHFLNYLEGQFDVPLRLMFENKAVRNCYVGISLLHRSGIFAKSDILSNVSGGSDMVSGHIECKR
ncbi:MipA/OmpV family protein [Marinobacter sp. 1-4A]|uniref:MipA/OmpV family protein n=1 Tax=Marinobacter sp. 1-4A TaxID=2582919 RepID=UPI001907EF32|nr:MipA/OmpV family protein [Marinobacter sp. 1-4A]MBK1851929.1 MipA/OmpV family protein [Marinobacter sp. 1-4A]